MQTHDPVFSPLYETRFREAAACISNPKVDDLKTSAPTKISFTNSDTVQSTAVFLSFSLGSILEWRDRAEVPISEWEAEETRHCRPNQEKFKQVKMSAGFRNLLTVRKC